jgi:hypothetical protein
MNVKRVEVNGSTTDITLPYDEIKIGECSVCFGSCYPPCKDSRMTWYCDPKTKEAVCFMP